MSVPFPTFRYHYLNGPAPTPAGLEVRNYQVTSDDSTSSATGVLLGGMRAEAPAEVSNFLVVFSGTFENDTDDAETSVAVWRGAAPYDSLVGASTRRHVTKQGQTASITVAVYVPNLQGVVDIRWHVSAGIGTFHDRTLMVIKV